MESAPHVDIHSNDADLARTRAHGRDASAFLAGLACGLTVGAVLGLLLAPKPGRDSRAWIANRSRQAGRRAKVLLDVSAVRDIIRRRGILGLRDAWQKPRDATRAGGPAGVA